MRPADDRWADTWHWIAVYDDETSVPEYDESGKARGFLSIDFDRLESFVLVSQVPDHVPHHVLTRKHKDSRVVFFRRRQVTANLDTGETSDVEVTIHCLGLERDGVGAYTFYFQDGSILMTDDVDAV